MKCTHLNSEQCLLNQALIDATVDDASVCPLCHLSLVALELQANQVGAALRDCTASHEKNAALPALKHYELAGQTNTVEQCAPASLPWQRLGDYRFIREIGRGGMGVVYEAEQISLGRRVALKLLPTSQLHGPNAAARFQREAAAAASLNHMNIVPIFESGKFENDTFYYAMQLITGRGLNEVCKDIERARSKAAANTRTTAADSKTRKKPSAYLLPTEKLGENQLASEPPGKAQTLWSTDSKQSHYRFVADLGRQAASALQHAHEQGIVHRDVKPANLIIDEQGNVWLTDFGLAKWQDEGLTKTQEAPGTLRYMSPERFGGLADARSDIYSLGATMYELLTLTPAFSAKNDLLLLEQIKNSQPRAPKSIDPFIPVDLQTVVLKAMAKESQHRYFTAAALKDDLERFLAGREILGRHVSAAERLWLWGKRNAGLATMIAIIVIGSVSAGLVGTYMAFKFSRMANDQTALAQQAQKAEVEARRSSYFLETNLVSMNLESDTSVIRIRDFLHRWSPGAADEDFRGWEWHFLNAFSRRERLVVDLKTPAKSLTPPISFGIDYTPDGAALAVPLTNQVLVLDSKSGKEILRLPENQGIIIALRFSHSGNLLAVTSEDGTLNIWDWKQRRLVQTVEYGNGLGSVCWHPNDEEVAFFSNGFGGEQDAIQVLDLITGNIRKIFLNGIGHHTRENGYSPDGRYFATSVGQPRERYSVVIFDTETWEVSDRKQLHSAYIYSIAWHPDGRDIASASLDGTVSLWEIDTAESTVLFQSSDGITSIDWSTSGDYLAFAGWDHGVRVWDYHGKRICDSLRGHETKLRALSWHPHKPEIASVDWYGQLRIFDVARPAINEYFLMSRGGRTHELSVTWHPNMNTLATSNAGDSYFWDMASKSHPPNLKLTRGLQNPVWSSDGKSLLQGSGSEGRLQITNEDKSNARTMELANKPQFFAWHHNQDSIYFTDSTNLYSVPSSFGVAPQKIAGPFRNILDFQLSPDGRQAALAIVDTYTPIVNLQTGNIVRKLPIPQMSSNLAVAWSPDGKLLASGGEDQVTEIWDTSNWTRIDKLLGHSFAITSIAWNPRQPRVATASRDKTIRVLETGSFRTTIVLTMDHEIGKVAWSPDGRRLAGIDIRGAIKIWDATQSYTLETGVRGTLR